MPSRPLRRLVVMLAAAAMLPIVAAAPVAAAGIVVNSKTMLTQDDGTCTLPEAIKAANTDTASGVSSGECAAGAGSDIITFSVSGTIYTTRLPDVVSPVTIDGDGKITLDARKSAGFAILDASGIYLVDLVITNGYAQFGGAFLVGSAGVVYVQGSTVKNSRAQLGGGFYVASGGDLYVWDSTISGNTATGSGGGIATTGSAFVQVLRSTVSGNLAQYGAGIIVSGTTTADVTNSTVAGNKASQSGGGIYAANGANVTVRNATISRNSATATAPGGFYADAAANTEMRNSILAGNTNGNLGGSLDTSANNIVGGSVTGLLDPDGLQDNGGPTKTIKLLATAAAAIDDGDAGVCAAGGVNGIDQRGLARGASCDIGAVERDRTDPTVTAPTVALRASTSLSGTSMRATVRWSGADTDGSGIRRYQLQQSVNGGSFSTISSTLTGTARSVTLANGSNYIFRVRAVDKDGNAGDYQTAIVVKPRLTQNTSSSIVYNGSWATGTSSSFSGGSVKYVTTANNQFARFEFTGSSIAFITTTGPTRGVVNIRLDGSYVGKLDMYSSTTKYRQVLYARSWPTAGNHVIEIYQWGAQGRKRLDIDAFAVLR
ncbi:MAG TPA: choice-of-anchor Q domain-containing protein [Candidatus Limnocylindrales bacterium]|nr:choice-of-anchor Q domain-containing protein [Candidatus Limnocylindrales bacterium]